MTMTEDRCRRRRRRHVINWKGFGFIFIR